MNKFMDTKNKIFLKDENLYKVIKNLLLINNLNHMTNYVYSDLKATYS